MSTSSTRLTLSHFRLPKRISVFALLSPDNMDNTQATLYGLFMSQNLPSL